MATRSLATDISASAPTGLREEDYRTFCAALETTQRGRDFLAEYARRNRNADTEILLDSLDRIEGMMQTEGKAHDRLRDELRVLLIAIRLARPDINSATALTKAARLVDLLDLMEHRIDAMVENKDLAPIAEEPLPVSQFTPAALAVVPRPDEPELPIPSIPALQAPAIALVQEPTRVVIKPLPQEALKAEAPEPEALKQELPQPEPLKQEMQKQEPQKQELQKQELQEHEWAQLEILNQPRLQINTPAEPYEIWQDPIAQEPVARAPVVQEVQEAQEAVAEALLAPVAETAAMPTAILVSKSGPAPEPTPPSKWLPDFGGEAQIIHTKPVRAAAFMPEVTFMAPAARPAIAETRAESAVVDVAVATVVTAAAETIASPAPTARAVPPRNDPLAAIMSLSEAERIALFT